ncbi:hypothetical protein CLOM_g5770 [Closterium sp. NIES-68]|nr:hypothetical protein CLOM_g5770 [Closterium sp. NIES-68]GJP73821.1 hypothetical protein CLOP_g4501 [Closterium sp. NIES-67]
MASPPSASATVALRTKGNAFYASAFTEGIDPLLKRSRLNVALSKYREALRRHVAESQPSADELSSLWKNIALASSTLAASHTEAYKAYKPPVIDAAASERVMVRTLRRAVEEKEWDYKEIEERYKEAVKAFCLALLFGSCEMRNSNTRSRQGATAGNNRSAKGGVQGSFRGGGGRPARSAPAKPEEWQQKVLQSFNNMISEIASFAAFARASSSGSGSGGGGEWQWRRDNVRDSGERLLWAVMGEFSDMRARDSWKKHLGVKDPDRVDWIATSTRHVEAFAAFHVAFSEFLLDKGTSLLTMNLARCSHSPQRTPGTTINASSGGAEKRAAPGLVAQRESARCFAECERPLRLLADALETLARNVEGNSCGNQSVTKPALKALQKQAKELHRARFACSCLCESVETLVRATALYARAGAGSGGGTNNNTGGTNKNTGGGVAGGADVALLWAAVDGFKEAVVLTKERHMDMEAYALSWLGHVYDVALQMDGIGHRYHQRAVQLVLSAVKTHPSLARSPWYSASVRAIDRHQAKIVRQEEQRREEEREPLLVKMKGELETLSKTADTGWKALLTHIYGKYPPKSGDHKCPSLNVDDAKVSLRTAILHYHPDKNSAHGSRWKILCEEVTKYLNDKYAVFTCA